MKKILSIAMALVLALSVMCPVAFAEDEPTQNDFVKRFVCTLADTDKDNNVTAKDARQVLLASAELTDNEVAKKADVDGDGLVTAIDARKVLRYSAGLIAGVEFLNDEALLGVFNNIMNQIKVDGQLVKRAYSSTCEDISTDNGKALDDLTSQMKKLDKNGEMGNFDMKAELLSSKGQTAYQNPVNNFSATAGSNFPIYDPAYSPSNAKSSLLTKDDIKSIKYATNQSVSFVRQQNQKTNGKYDMTKPVNVLSRIDLAGLDSITVEVKDDLNLKNIPAPASTKLHTGKLFTIPTQADLNASLGDVATQIQGVKDEMDKMFDEMDNSGMGGLGKVLVTKRVVDVSTSLKSIDFKNSYMTIYFDPVSLKPVYAKYSMGYTYSMNMYMDMHISIPIMVVYINVDKQNIGVNQTTRDTDTYLFMQNYKDFVVSENWNV